MQRVQDRELDGKTMDERETCFPKSIQKQEIKGACTR